MKNIERHLKNGDIVIFISGSPDFLVKKMAGKYNVTDYLGSKYIMEDGKFSGKLVPLWDSESKNKAINELIEKYDIDLDESFAYGDTNGDINMLRKVGHPVAINPTNELLSKLREDLIEKYDIDLDESFAYGDTNGDINMLRKVGHPVAINPTNELLSKLREDPMLKKKADIIVERKDILYKLKPDVQVLSYDDLSD